MRLLLVEVVESGYAAFTRYMSPVMQKAGLYDDLLYFGHTHNDAEADHDLYQDPDAIPMEEVISRLSDQEKAEAGAMISDLFTGLHAMHDCFADSIIADED